MGLFNSYLKPGPGIDKDAPKKKGIFLFLELFKRKFFKIIQANMLFFAVSIPFIVLTYVFAPTAGIMDIARTIPEIADESVMILQNWLHTLFAMFMLSFFGSGPASAGLAYIYRCITREEHAWIWSDFFKKFKENFKQAILVTIVDILAFVIMIFAISFYYTQYIATGNTILFIALFFAVFVSGVFVLMHSFVYQIMITYECKFLQLLKNSLILTLAKLPMMVLLSLIGVLILFVSTFYTGLFALPLYFLILYSVIRFPLEFYAARTVNRLIAQNAEAQTEENNQ